MSGGVRKVGMVIHPVGDLDAAEAFYRDALGLEPMFRDGDRFAAFKAGDVTIALAAGEEILSDRATVSYKVDDLEDSVAALKGAGASVERDIEEGPHERRAVLRDPAGNPFVLYSGK